MGQKEIGFSLGANWGDRLAALVAARDRLAARPGARLVAQSPVYETEPVGVQPAYADLAFLNAVIVIESDEPAETWLEAAAALERDLGRVRTEDRCAPRTIDIDILYDGDRLLGDGGLVLPHPRWALRRFVVQPLADVRPGLVLPGADRSVRDVLAALPPGEAVRLFRADW